MTKKTSDKKMEKFEAHYLIPGLIGGIMAFIFSGSLILGVEVLLAVIVTSYLVHWAVKRK